MAQEYRSYYKKGNEKIWTLRRLKKIGSSIEFMIDVYIKEIRSLLEQAVQIWHSGLTLKQDAQIERVQKTALFVILDKNYLNYENSCVETGLDTLRQRREDLCYNFSKKNLKSKDVLFTKVDGNHNLRRGKVKVKEYFCRTKRFRNSPLPYLARLLNSK